MMTFVANEIYIKFDNKTESPNKNKTTGFQQKLHNGNSGGGDGFLCVFFI